MVELERVRNGLSRKKFIKLSSTALATGTATCAIKAIGFKESQGFTIPEEELLERIYKRPDKNFQLGLYPNSSHDLETFRKYVFYIL